MNQPKTIEYFISVLTEKCLQSRTERKWNIMLRFICEQIWSKSEFLIDESHLIHVKNGSTVSTNRQAFIHKFKINLNEIGKIKKLAWISSSVSVDILNTLVYEIQIEIPYRNELLIFPIAKPFDKTDNLILEPNLNPGEIGINYTVVCHTNYQQKLNDPKLPLNVAIQLIGEKNNTNFIPLQHSQINKVPFLAGRRDIFSIVTADVGRIIKTVLRNYSESSSENSWFVGNCEIRTFNNSHAYNLLNCKKSFPILKNLLPNEEVILLPMRHSEIEYQIVLACNEIEREVPTNQKLNDIYFIIIGEQGTTKKIHLNNYEINSETEFNRNSRLFEFKSEDVGKILKINVSLNEDMNPANFIFIDYIEIKIPIRKEAYKFPCERALGAFYEDGKMELDLEVWKHPEKKIHIEYELKHDTSSYSEKNTAGCVYLVIHGDQGKTGKIELNDGSFENNAKDDFIFNAPDVGKISKIELFYTPTVKDNFWQIETLEIKIAKRNEAYKFPAELFLDKDFDHVMLEPWRKPQIDPINRNRLSFRNSFKRSVRTKKS